MARRNVLHRNKLEHFKAWLVDNDIAPLEPVGDYEVLRWKNVKGQPMCIIFDGKSPEHLSCNNAARAMVSKFVNE